MFSADPNEAYNEFIALAAASLAPNEYWCVHRRDGPLLKAKSKDVGEAVRVVCDALNADWDELQESGFWLGRVTVESST